MHRAMSEFEGKAGKQLALSSSQFDPDVWSGRALQVDFAELAVSGLASMYPAFISARAISLTDRPQRAIWVTSVRMCREDRTSISSHPLADLGRLKCVGQHHRVLLISLGSRVRSDGRRFVSTFS